MTPSRKPLALFLTILLALSTVALSSSTNAEETSARVTNNEEIIVSVNDIYYDRGGDITFTVTSTNLDPATEYTIDWKLCYYNYNGCTSSFVHDSSASGVIDLGSGNLFSVSTITFTDPGLLTEYYDSATNDYFTLGVENGSFSFHAKLHVQGVELHTNTSDGFILGGELTSSSINTIPNILKTMDVSFYGQIYMDHSNRYILEYTLTCNLFESGSTTSVDSITRIINTSYDDSSFSGSVYDSNTNSYDVLTPTASSGDHYVECDFVRNVDNALLGTMTSNVFQVIDADVTGNEEGVFDAMSSKYYPRSDSATTSSISFDVVVDNLFSGTEYTIDWNLCYYNYNGCTGDFAQDSTTSGSVTFTATSNGPHTESVIFTDPGLFTEYYDSATNQYVTQGVENRSFSFHAKLHVQGVELHTNTSDAFILGGELTSSSINTIPNILKTMDVSFYGQIYMDHSNRYILEYTLTCNLFESGSTTSVDSITRIINTSYEDSSFSGSVYDSNTNSYDVLTPTASSGGHYVECDFVRNVDNALLGTMTSNVFQVIDADVTGNEEVVFDAMSSKYYPRSDSATTSSISFDVVVDNLFSGTEYTIDWNLCYYNYNGCTGDFAQDSTTSGSVTFTATSNGPHTESVTFTDPGLLTEYYDPATNYYGIQGVENRSFSFHAKLHVQGVELHTNTSDAFILGGELTSSSINTIPNILKTMDVSFYGQIYMDHSNRYILEYTLTCNLFESGSTTSVDSITRIINTSYDDSSFSGSVYDSNTNSYDVLTPTASSGDHYVECDFVRNVDNALLGTMTSNVFQVIDDTSNQDDATISVAVNMHSTEAWGTVTIDAIDLDAGQEYTLNWAVEDYSLSPPTTMMQNDHIWVAGNDGTYTYELDFHDLADTTNACITVTFTAGNDELQVVDNVCWASASTADGDGDNVYDKNDLCPNTTAGLAVDADGCSDSDNDGFDTDLEIDCNTDPNNALSFPTDLDGDLTCDYLDTDKDGDGYLDVDELAAGTDPLDANSKPANRLPVCAVYYNLEIDGIPTSFDGEAAIPALSGVTATTAAAALTPTTVTIPAGSYYITAHCIDPDGDDVTVTVNDVTVGPIAGEVSGAALIEIGEDVDETIDVQITWTDGTDSLTALVTVELDGDSGGLIPGFGASLTIMALLGAGFVLVRKDD